jgi:hypothetical protein
MLARPGAWYEAVPEASEGREWEAPEASEHRQWEARLPVEKWIRNRRVFVHDGVLVRVARFIRNDGDEVIVILDDTPQRVRDRVSKLPRPRRALLPGPVVTSRGVFWDVPDDFWRPTEE